MPPSEKPRILVTTTVPPDLRGGLSVDNELIDWDRVAKPPAPGVKIALTTSMAGFDASMMAALPDVKLIGCQGAGLDRIDLVAAAKQGIAVCHTPEAVTEDTADFAIGLMYAVSRRIVEADKFVRAGRWAKERMAVSRRVADKTVGIVGMGRIGKVIARRTAGLGMTVLYSARAPKADLPYGFVADVPTLAEKSDVLIMACPGGAETHHLANAEVFAKLGPTGYLINVSRGSVVDEDALIKALTERTIAGAGLDVFEPEPIIDERFKALDNVVLAPHYASLTFETRTLMIATLANDIAAFVAGRPLRYKAAAG